MIIKVSDPRDPRITALLEEHLQEMAAISPPESCHALDVEKLRRPEVTFWAAWEGEELLGTGALQELDAEHAEIKSMRTARAHLRKGVAAAILERILEEARSRGYHRLSLETGSTYHFQPAVHLYERFGFQKCGPFGKYVQDPFSLFMTRELETNGPETINTPQEGAGKEHRT
jgi:putative acetyltransferase